MARASIGLCGIEINEVSQLRASLFSASIGLCGIEMVLGADEVLVQGEPQSDCVELKFIYAARAAAGMTASIGLCGIEMLPRWPFGAREHSLNRTVWN